MSIRLITTFVLIVSSGSHLIYCQQTAIEFDQQRIAWGKAVNGLQLGISAPVQLNKSYDFVGFEKPVSEDGTLQVTVHLRNTSTKRVRFLPTVWDCLAMGDDGAIPVSEILLTPESGEDPLSLVYQGWNHLMLLDKRRDKPDASDEIRKNAEIDKDIQLDRKKAKHRQIELSADEAVWPEWVRFNPTQEKKSLWRLTDQSNHVVSGKYRVTAVLLIDQEFSEWKGKLTSGQLELEMPANID